MLVNRKYRVICCSVVVERGSRTRRWMEASETRYHGEREIGEGESTATGCLDLQYLGSEKLLIVRSDVSARVVMSIPEKVL